MSLDGAYMSRNFTLTGFDIMYGRGTSTYGTVQYVLDDISIANGDQSVIAEVHWPSGREELACIPPPTKTSIHSTSLS